MARLYTSKLARKRNAYFSERGWIEPPYSQEDRFDLAQKLYDQDDYETTLMLYDEIEDFDNPNFLNLLGNIFADKRSVYFNQEQATRHFRRAFRHVEDSELKTEISQKFISSYVTEKNVNPDTTPEIFSDPHIAQAVLYLTTKSIEPSALRFTDSVNRTAYYLATVCGSGRSIEINHQSAVELYETYFNEENHGYLAQTYQNLAIRHALGLGCSSDPEKAVRIIKTAQILLNGAVVNPVLVSTLERLAKNQSDFSYIQTANKIKSKINDNCHPWTMVTYLQEPDAYNKQAMSDIIFLTSFLAHAEHWKHTDKWKNMSHSGARKSYTAAQMDFDFCATTKLSDVSYFSHRALEIEGKAIALSSKRIEIHDYFKQHGLGFPLKDQEERLEKAKELNKEATLYHEGIALLFDELEDADHSDWLCFMGGFFDQDIDSSYFDSEKSLSFYKRSAILGNKLAAYYIGQKYQIGKEGPVDLEEAIYWYEKAFDYGYKDAAFRIAECKLEQRRISNPSGDIRPDDEYFRLYKDNVGSFNLSENFLLARCYINGDGVPRSIENALKYYQIILDDTVVASLFGACLPAECSMATRYLLGLDVNSDIQKAEDILLRKYKFHGQKLFSDRILASIDKFNSSRDSSRLYIEAREFIQRVYYGGHSPEDYIVDISTGKILMTEELFLCLDSMSQLANDEDWRNKKSWKRLYEAALAKKLGLTFESMTAATLDSGPRYTRLNPQGIPILGDFEKASASEEEVLHQQITQGSFVPCAGDRIFDGLSYHPENGIELHARGIGELPALLLPEDYDVVLALCFGEPNSVTVPSLSLESIEETDLDPYSQMQRKVFDPPWLGHTNFGKTLAITDAHMGELSWRILPYAANQNSHNVSDEDKTLTRLLIEGVELTGGRYHEGSKRIMIKPQEGDHYLTGKFLSSDGACVTVDGSYVVGEERDVAENDTRYLQGRTTKYLSDNYDIVGRLDPRFERVHQLMKLFYTVANLTRVTTFTPPIGLRQEAQEKLRAFEAKGPLSREDMYCRRVPL